VAARSKAYIPFACWDCGFESRRGYGFFVLLTTHLGIILISNHLDAQFFFLICLFQFSTCFEQPRAHHQENQLYQCNIWYLSLCVSDHLVGRSFRTYILDGHLYQIYQMLHWYSWFSWWWARGCSKHVENWNKHIRKKELCVKLVTYKRVWLSVSC
jgi:hypothetical protein